METRTQDAPPTPTTATRSRAFTGPLMFALLVLLACVALRQVRPPDAVGPGAPATEFSSARAMTHLRAIAQQPRTLGSAEHARVRDYLVSTLSEYGLRTEVQKAEVVLARGSYPVRAATVENVVGRMAGASAGGGRATLLMAHYDSAAGAPGAADDGSGVAALLETARALKAGGPPRGDIIVLLTDGEELGMLGARAFLDEHPLAKEVGLVLNFEARGNRGPSMMFETGGAGDDALMKEFARAAPYPFASSLSDEVYRRLPNDTDFSPFKRAGYAGFNFAFIEGLTHYHTALDTVENVDERSVQHQGSYALALARRFADGGTPPPSGGRSVYFNTLGSALVHYPSTLVVPLAAVTTLLLVGVYALGLRRRQLTVRGTAFGFVATLLTAALSGALGTGLWWAVRALHGGWLPGGVNYRTHYYVAAFALLVVALAAALHVLLRRRTGAANLAAGALLWWLLLTWATSLLMPGASYLFMWPLLFSLCGLAYVIAERGFDPTSPKQFAVLLLCAAPVILLLAPTLYLLYVAFSMGLVWAILVLAALGLGLLVLQLGVVNARGRGLVPALTAAVGLGLLLIASLTAGFDRERPRFDSASYALGGDTGRALWVSPDRAPDAWTSQFFQGQTEVGTLEQFVASRFPYLKAPAPAAPLPAPGVAVVEDATSGDIRSTRLRVTSARGAQSLTVYLGPETEVVRAWVGGREVDLKALPPSGARSPWSVQYWGLPAEGFELRLETRAGRPLSLTVVDSTEGLPRLEGFTYRPRPEDTIPAPFPFSDATLVNKTYTF
jgi:hypothetical protein